MSTYFSITNCLSYIQSPTQMLQRQREDPVGMSLSALKKQSENISVTLLRGVLNIKVSQTHFSLYCEIRFGLIIDSISLISVGYLVLERKIYASKNNMNNRRGLGNVNFCLKKCSCMIFTRYLHVTLNISIHSRIRAKLGLKPLEVGNEKKQQHTGMLTLCLW